MNVSSRGRRGRKGSRGLWVGVGGLAVAAVALAAVAGAQSEESTCEYSSYQLAYDYERDEGSFSSRQDGCSFAIDNLRKQQFGPPTQWEVFNAICKGDCRAYADIITRITTGTDCRCQLISAPNYQCPTTPTDMLCDVVQYCYDWDTYYASYCAVDACGRFAESEDDWRRSRAACGAPVSIVSALLVALLTISLSLSLITAPR